MWRGVERGAEEESRVPPARWWGPSRGGVVEARRLRPPGDIRARVVDEAWRPLSMDGDPAGGRPIPPGRRSVDIVAHKAVW